MAGAAFGLGELLKDSEPNPGLIGVCVSVSSSEITQVSGGDGEHDSIECFGIRASDEESYSYRIGMIHMCREVAYANAGVRSDSLLLRAINVIRVAFDV